MPARRRAPRRAGAARAGGRASPTSRPGSAARTTRCASTWTTVPAGSTCWCCRRCATRPADASRARMPGMSVLAIDAGTTGVTALVVTARGHASPPRATRSSRQHFPRARLGRARARGDLAGHPGGHPRLPRRWDDGSRRPGRHRHHQPARDGAALGPRDARLARGARSSGRTGVPPRSAGGCARTGHEERVTELTGLRLDPYFSGTKLVWLAENEPNTWALVEDGRYAIGTVDSYLVARMTRGTWHVTDVSNACRTLLFDLEEGAWSDELCDLFGVPRDALPEIVPNWGELATTDPRSFLGLELPIAGIAGDQQSALFGQTCFDVGDSKCTYGTGSFILTNTGTEVVALRRRACSPRRPGRSPDGRADLRARGRDLRDRRGGPVAARRPPDRRVGRRDRGDRRHRRRHRRRGVRARADRARRPALGPARPRPDPRHHPGHDARAHRPRDAGGDHLRGARRGRHAADARR